LQKNSSARVELVIEANERQEPELALSYRLILYEHKRSRGKKITRIFAKIDPQKMKKCLR